jgi:hypothetical protein
MSMSMSISMRMAHVVECELCRQFVSTEDEVERDCRDKLSEMRDRSLARKPYATAVCPACRQVVILADKHAKHSFVHRRMMWRTQQRLESLTAAGRIEREGVCLLRPLA